MAGEEGAADFGLQELDEGFGELCVFALLTDGGGDLTEGGVEVVGDEVAAAVVDEAPGEDGAVGVAGFGELLGLADVFGVDDLVLDLFPEPGAAEGGLGGLPVRGELGVGDGDDADGGLVEIAEVANGAGFGPETDAADGVDLHFFADDAVALDEGGHEVFVGAEEEVEGGAVFDLSGEGAGGGEAEGEVGEGEGLFELGF